MSCLCLERKCHLFCWAPQPDCVTIVPSLGETHRKSRTVPLVTQGSGRSSEVTSWHLPQKSCQPCKIICLLLRSERERDQIQTPDFFYFSKNPIEVDENVAWAGREGIGALLSEIFASLISSIVSFSVLCSANLHTILEFDKCSSKSNAVIRGRYKTWASALLWHFIFRTEKFCGQLWLPGINNKSNMLLTCDIQTP